VLIVYTSHFTASQAVWKAARNPAFAIRKGRKKATKPTAGKAVQLLESIAVLVGTSGKARDRTFAYQAYLERLRAGTELEGRP
jgi:hypothetical protein